MPHNKSLDEVLTNQWNSYVFNDFISTKLVTRLGALFRLQPRQVKCLESLNKTRFDCFWWYMYTHIIVCRESIVQLIKIQFFSKVYPWGRIQLLNSQVLSSRGLKRPFVGHSMPILKRRHGFTREIRRSQDLRAFAGSCAWVALAAKRIQNQNKFYIDSSQSRRNE